jgi:hypothetical protein
MALAVLQTGFCIYIKTILAKEISKAFTGRPI